MKTRNPVADRAQTRGHATASGLRRTTSLRRGSIPASVLAGALLLLACRTAIVGSEVAEPPPSTFTPAATAATPAVSATPTGTRTPPPSMALDDRGLPVGAIGPLLVFRTITGDDPSSGHSSPIPEVVVFDVGARVELGRIWIGDPAGAPQASFLAGRHLLVNAGDASWRYALDGTREQLIEAPPGTFITGLAVDDADGVVVATIQTSRGIPVRRQRIDLATGTLLPELAAVNLGEPLTPIGGGFNESVPPDEVTYARPPGGYAFLEVDGSVHEFAVNGFSTPSPDGRFVTHGPGGACEAVSGPRIGITDAATGALVAEYRNARLSFFPWGWSPDGTEFAFQTLPLLAGGPCADTRAEPDWLVLSIDGSLRRPASGLTLVAEWYGGRAITFRCGNQLDPGWISRFDGLLRPNNCTQTDVEIRLADTPIAVEENIAILGFIEVD